MSSWGGILKHPRLYHPVWETIMERLYPLHQLVVFFPNQNTSSPYPLFLQRIYRVRNKMKTVVTVDLVYYFISRTLADIQWNTRSAAQRATMSPHVCVNISCTCVWFVWFGRWTIRTEYQNIKTYLSWSFAVGLQRFRFLAVHDALFYFCRK